VFWSVIKKSKTLLEISCKENLKEGKNINKKMSKKDPSLKLHNQKLIKLLSEQYKCQLLHYQN
jgi:hypothetical protein